jgi:hypothetical protein
MAFYEKEPFAVNFGESITAIPQQDSTSPTSAVKTDLTFGIETIELYTCALAAAWSWLECS